VGPGSFGAGGDLVGAGLRWWGRTVALGLLPSTWGSDGSANEGGGGKSVLHFVGWRKKGVFGELENE